MSRRISVTLATLVAVASPAHAEEPGGWKPGGWKIDASDCASGGPTTWFFEGGDALQEGCGDDCPIILRGTWKRVGDEVRVAWRQRFFGRGSEQSPGPTPARIIYERYDAALEDVATSDTFAWPVDSCETAARHDQTSADPRALLRTGFSGRFPFTSERALTPEDLAGRSKADLEVMRNEVYARYGYTFKNARLRKHFEAQPGYRARFAEVSAWLSPLERDNVAAILKAEKAAR
jgi:hypothetical protein